MTTPDFTHDALTPSEPIWLLSTRWDAVPDVTTDDLVADLGRVLVLAAHPDDETLGVGGLVHDLSAAGHEVVVVVASDGEASHPLAHVSPEWLAATRREECRTAVAGLGVSEVVFLGVPDGGVGLDGDETDGLLAPHLDAGTTVLAPWVGDGHPDHERLGRSAARVAGDIGGRVWFYPIWLWHWADEHTLPWDRAVTFSPSAAALHSKEAAIASHRSQVEALGQAEGEGAVLTDTGLAPSRRLVETLISDRPLAPAVERGSRAGSAAQDFDAMFDETDDPWGFETSWYEARKRSLTLAALGREHYGSVLDVGCSTGVLTAELVTRADHVTAVDHSLAALRRAGARLQGQAGVDLVHGSTGSDLPRTSYDVVVLSEVGYFLTGAELLALLRWIRRLLTPGGEIVLCHWRHPTRDVPLDGPLVHRQARAALDLACTASYVDDDLLLDVWSASGSVASGEGIA